jgi:hypothetical protein
MSGKPNNGVFAIIFSSCPLFPRVIADKFAHSCSLLENKRLISTWFS